MYNKVVEGLVPGIPSDKYLTPEKAGRNVRAKQYTNFNTTDIIDSQVCNQ